MKWRAATDKPAKLLESYYCKVYSDQLKKGFKKTVLITLDGSWQTEYTVIEWLDESESPSPSSGVNVLVEAIENLNSKLDNYWNADAKSDALVKEINIAQRQSANAIAEYNLAKRHPEKENDILGILQWLRDQGWLHNPYVSNEEMITIGRKALAQYNAGSLQGEQDDQIMLWKEIIRDFSEIIKLGNLADDNVKNLFSKYHITKKP